jgi:hypothetical protein
LQYQDTTVVFDQFGNRFEAKLEKGSYKKHPNNPKRPDGSLHEYCPPEHVASEMDRLIEFHDRHVQLEVSALIEAAWLHHTFTQIHPFQDGNGRVARALATLVLIKAELLPLVVQEYNRAKYIEALELADGGDLAPLVALFSRLQKRDLTRAIGRAVDAKPVSSVDEAVVVTRDLLVGLGKTIPPQYLEAKNSARRLAELAAVRLNSVAITLTREIAGTDFAFGVAALGSPPAAELRFLAERLEYDPNPAEFSQNFALNLAAQGATAKIVVSFHIVGTAFRGLIGVIAYFQAGSDLPAPLSDDIFRIDYKESFAELEERFTKWLDACLIQGLAEWRKTLV